MQSWQDQGRLCGLSAAGTGLSEFGTEVPTPVTLGLLKELAALDFVALTEYTVLGGCQGRILIVTEPADC